MGAFNTWKGVDARSLCSQLHSRAIGPFGAVSQTIAPIHAAYILTQLTSVVKQNAADPSQGQPSVDPTGQLPSMVLAGAGAAHE